jgi:hypothetical protein
MLIKKAVGVRQDYCQYVPSIETIGVTYHVFLDRGGRR